MALNIQEDATYYNDKREYGNYQFTSLDNTDVLRHSLVKKILEKY